MGFPSLKPALLGSISLVLAACASTNPILDQSAISTNQAPNLLLATSTIFIADNEIFAVSVAQIRISSPGPESQITSPIELEALLYPSASGTIKIELYKSNGSLLARKILNLADPIGQVVHMHTRIDFEVSRASQAAYLIVSTQDEYGRLQALNSVDLNLLAAGEDTLTSGGDFIDSIQISAPKEGDEISGGFITISGQANSQPGRPLNIQLITREGRVLNFGEVYPHFEPDSEWGTFEIKLSYEVKEATWVQIAITENEAQIPRPIHFIGLEVLLNP